MKLDELAFFNQQLAGMLKAGLPLEGSLRQLSAGMTKGKFRDQLKELEGKLAAGEPLEKAVAASKLPDFYKRMLIAGRKAEALPQVLLLLADYYQQASVLAIRIKGVLLYPGMIIIGSWLLSMLIWYLYFSLRDSVMSAFRGMFGGSAPPQFIAGMVLPSVIVTLVAIGYLVVTLTPSLRRLAMWKLPGLKEASIARLSHLFGMMLQSGCPLKETLPVLRELEHGGPAQRMIYMWEKTIAEGDNRFESLAASKSPMPPLFFWLVGNDRENWTAGLLRASSVYHHRARNQLELILMSVTPVCVILLGMLILYQSFALYSSLLSGFLDYL